MKKFFRIAVTFIFSLSLVLGFTAMTAKPASAGIIHTVKVSKKSKSVVFSSNYQGLGFRDRVYPGQKAKPFVRFAFKIPRRCGASVTLRGNRRYYEGSNKRAIWVAGALGKFGTATVNLQC